MKISSGQILRLCAVSVAAAGLAWGQPPAEENPDRLISPERGQTVGMAYQLSEIESVNMSNGGLTLRIPLAQLPAGPGGAAGVSLVYNSKYWEDHPTSYPDPASKSVTHALSGAPGGGWKFKFDYEVEGVYFENRNSVSEVCSPGPLHLVQLRLTSPDGSQHKMYKKGTDSMPQFCEVGPVSILECNFAAYSSGRV